ncbi:DUF3489 domain-containing protein [Brucella intermedia]|uniref:DUF3489 domain-containing protein n=1 Tax=Brucella intermedia TaxID=94625 RepID=UPI00244A2B62|nr:DUF3489 domain-containing protein [Brucella intermedia]WGG59333.1 DUF3489 domain-containing protein [Brucella intermedia]
MTKLSDTQAIILNAAAQREDRIALPLPESLRGGAAAKVVGAMLVKGFLEEVDADMRRGEPVWRETGDGHGTTLIITDAGFAAIGIAPDEVPNPVAPRSATAGDTRASAGIADHDSTPNASAPTAPAGAKARTPCEGTKQAALIAMLRMPNGATIDEIMAATGWQSHTVRGAMAGALKKKLGLEVSSEKVEGRGRVYRLPAA